MKAVLLLLAFCALALATPLSEAQYRFLFRQWRVQHKKGYMGYHESVSRFSIFKQNLDKVMKHNAEAAQGKHTFRLGMNQFSDLTVEEYRKAVLGGYKRRPIPARATHHSTVNLTVTDAPASIDWRTLGAVNPVKDQSQCGSCWAFSATAAMESAHFRATKQLLSFSEQMCVDCANNGQNLCNTGGNMQDCFTLVNSQGGEELEASYPYQANSPTSQFPCRVNKTLFVAPEITGFQNLPANDENALLQASATQGVISIAIDASHDSFQQYTGGVYSEPACDPTALDHAVAVVGYGTDPTLGDYWIVRNSWGPVWGENGYIRMARNKNNMCGIATDATYPTTK